MTRRILRTLVACLCGLAMACESPSVDSAPNEAPVSRSGPSGERSAPSGDEPSAAAVSPDIQARSRARVTKGAVVLQGETATGDSFDSQAFVGQRLVVFFFDREEPRAAAVARGVAHVVQLAPAHNFALVGLALGADAEQASTFALETGLDVPIVLDPDRTIARGLGTQSRLALMGIDARGVQTYFSAGFPSDPERAMRAAEAQLREHLRLDRAPTRSTDYFPPAPAFVAPRLGGGEALSLASLKGRPVVLIFFLHGCPYCQMALDFHINAIASIPEARRPRLVGIEVSGASDEVVARRIASLDLRPFEIVRDPEWTVQQAYGVFGDVPITFYLDAALRIIDRAGPGWDEVSDPPLSAMYLSKIAGLDVPPFIHATGYSGNEVCGACHFVQQSAWRETAHASALDTLVDHGRERDPACVKCHTVGFGEPGGYQFRESRGDPDHLEGVGCESCHGRGGPHLSNTPPKTDYEPVCLGCHDDVHSLGFDYARDSARISHRAIAALDREGREALRRADRPLLPQAPSFVGSEACRDCHAREYAIWSQGAHARAGDTLVRHPDFDTACLRCHTTGLGRVGGFPARAELETHHDLGRVGCESCHGPGGDHVAPEAVRTGSIVRLTEKCNSCVILQICGSCHDHENDPGFGFEVEAAIERQQHGGFWQRAEGS